MMADEQIEGAVQTVLGGMVRQYDNHTPLTDDEHFQYMAEVKRSERIQDVRDGGITPDWSAEDYPGQWKNKIPVQNMNFVNVDESEGISDVPAKNSWGDGFVNEYLSQDTLKNLSNVMDSMSRPAMDQDYKKAMDGLRQRYKSAEDSISNDAALDFALKTFGKNAPINVDATSALGWLFNKVLTKIPEALIAESYSTIRDLMPDHGEGGYSRGAYPYLVLLNKLNQMSGGISEKFDSLLDSYVRTGGRLPDVKDIPWLDSLEEMSQKDPGMVAAAVRQMSVFALMMFVPGGPGSMAVKGGVQGTKLLAKTHRLFRSMNTFLRRKWPEKFVRHVLEPMARGGAADFAAIEPTDANSARMLLNQIEVMEKWEPGYIKSIMQSVAPAIQSDFHKWLATPINAKSMEQWDRLKTRLKNVPLGAIEGMALDTFVGMALLLKYATKVSPKKLGEFFNKTKQTLADRLPNVVRLGVSKSAAFKIYNRLKDEGSEAIISITKKEGKKDRYIVFIDKDKSSGLTESVDAIGGENKGLGQMAERQLRLLDEYGVGAIQEGT
ncbi:hypothetical protein [uncultured Mediterranean phage uvDeep-CGR2-AD3-C191]|nr:hypothetical protein [uncultured Mediterranean phage uvDeep-CGR2-AD3-C191]